MAHKYLIVNTAPAGYASKARVSIIKKTDRNRVYVNYIENLEYEDALEILEALDAKEVADGGEQASTSES